MRRKEERPKTQTECGTLEEPIDFYNFKKRGKRGVHTRDSRMKQGR